MENNEITNQPLTQLTLNQWKLRTLAAAIKLEIFDIINNNSAAEIAEKINSDKDATERLLNALVSIDFLIKQDNNYKNTLLSEKFLIKSSKFYYGDFILMSTEFNDFWKQLDKCVKTGEKIIEQGTSRMANPSFTKAMHNNAIVPATLVSEKFDFSNKTHLLDIGGGSGVYSIILTNKFTNLKATILEQPQVCETAKQFIQQEGNTEKINLLSGDYFTTEFPKHDIALFGQIFHSNSENENKQLVKKAFNSMENTGIILITEFILNEEKTSPILPALFSLNMLLQSSGKSYTFSEIKQWLEETGFKNINQQHLTGPVTLIWAEKQ